MDRRAFLGTLAGGAVALSAAAIGPSRARPVVGFLRSTVARPFGRLAKAFEQGLSENGYVAGQNVSIEYRYADERVERLPALAADLVRRNVSVIVGNGLAAEAARRVTSTIPIVFVTSDDPVARGLVDDLARPTGNVTGITSFGGRLIAAKRFELLRELAPEGSTFAVLVDPKWPGSRADLEELRPVARSHRQEVVVLEATSKADLELAFARVAKSRIAALMVSGSPMFSSERRTIVALAAQHRVPAVYDIRDYVNEGGLLSLAASFTGAYRQAGIYAGRILLGTPPSELPVVQPTTFELVVSLRTARAMGIDVPQSILFRADEVLQ